MHFKQIKPQGLFKIIQNDKEWFILIIYFCRRVQKGKFFIEHAVYKMYIFSLKVKYKNLL